MAKLAGAMKASLSGAASLFNAPLAQTARVLGALQAKAQQDAVVDEKPVAPEAEAAATAAPAAEPVAVGKAAVETTTEA